MNDYPFNQDGKNILEKDNCMCFRNAILSYLQWFKWKYPEGNVKAGWCSGKGEGIKMQRKAYRWYLKPWWYMLFTRVCQCICKMSSSSKTHKFITYRTLRHLGPKLQNCHWYPINSVFAYPVMLSLLSFFLNSSVVSLSSIHLSALSLSLMYTCQILLKSYPIIFHVLISWESHSRTP